MSLFEIYCNNIQVTVEKLTSWQAEKAVVKERKDLLASNRTEQPFARSVICAIPCVHIRTEFSELQSQKIYIRCICLK